MSELLTQCPHCQTPFRVTTAQLEAAEGLVRCGSCLGLFSGSLNLIRVKPAPPEADEAPFDDDDVPLGDFDLDAEAEDYDEEYAEDETAPVAADNWEPYEEYQEAGDLFAGLEDADADEADAQADAADTEAYATDPDDEDWDEEDWEEEDDWDDDPDADTDATAEPLSEDEFDTSELVDFEDEELEYEYSRIVVLEEEHGLLVDDTLDSDAEDETQDEAADAPILDDPVRARDKSRLRSQLGALHDDDALEPLADADLEILDDDPVLLEAARHQRRQRLQQAGLALASLLLLCSLVLQFVNTHLEALSQRATFAPFLPLTCRLLDCPPPQGSTSFGSLYSQELLIRTHPRVPGALEVSFLFRNDADNAQPFPGLELSFRKLDNTLLANRLFRPEEYLPPELRPLGQMPANSSVQILLQLVDPGPAAVNYTMAFREL